MSFQPINAEELEQNEITHEIDAIISLCEEYMHLSNEILILDELNNHLKKEIEISERIMKSNRNVDDISSKLFYYSSLKELREYSQRIDKNKAEIDKKSAKKEHLHKEIKFAESVLRSIHVNCSDTLLLEEIGLN